MKAGAQLAGFCAFLRLFVPILLFLSGVWRTPADTVAWWNFNSPSPDADPTTGTFSSAIGQGTASVLNASWTFRDSATGLDSSGVDNSCLRMNGFPGATTGNKTAGIEFRFSTVGYEGLILQYDHNNSSTASRYYRAQYTSDGANWIDHAVITNQAPGWFVYTVDFKDVRAADNNPKFGVRLVSEFESTATGSGAASYVASQPPATYNPAGTFWVDRVLFTAQTNRFLPLRLQIQARDTSVDVLWPRAQGHLEQTIGLRPPAWMPVSGNTITSNGMNLANLPTSPAPRSFRLRQETFRAMSYNIHHGEGTDGVLNLARIAAVINAQAPDIVGLQEVDKNTVRCGLVDQLAELGRMTGMFYFFGKNINYDGGQYGLGVLSKFPIKAQHHVLFNRQNLQLEQRGMNILQLDAGESDVFFLNTHLDHTTSDSERLYQISQIKTLAQSYPSGKLLLCGDFNFTPGGTCHASMILAFSDNWPRAANGNGFTFPSILPNRRIDFFWTKALDIRPIRGWIPLSLASDHSPLVMDFLLPPPN